MLNKLLSSMSSFILLYLPYADVCETCKRANSAKLVSVQCTIHHALVQGLSTTMYGLFLSSLQELNIIWFMMFP